MHLPTFLFSAHHRWAAFEKWMENTHNNTLCRRLAAVSVVEVRGCCTICGAAVLCASEKTRNRRWRRRSGWLCSCFFYEKCISQSYVYDAAKYKNRHVREKAKRSAKNDQQRHYKLILFCSTFTIYSIRCVFSRLSSVYLSSPYFTVVSMGHYINSPFLCFCSTRSHRERYSEVSYRERSA